jgi:23S rRNA (cytidine1920-2'-O)/16S rRNA (cytidine1409-2'-O)-methyltransferase
LFCAALEIVEPLASAGVTMPLKTSKQKTEKTRLDILLVERGLAETRQKAQAMLLAGEVRVNGQRADKPGARVNSDASVELVGERPRYASRGGIKLEGALKDFGVCALGKICLDVGSSTGGFTDCLLQNGAARVYALDVSPEQLAWRLQQDPRVIQIHRNAREVSRDDLPENPQLITLDVSFISVAKVLPAVASVAGPGAEFLILVKPQFELDRGDVGKGGIIRDAKLHERAVERVRAAAIAAGLTVLGVKASQLTGAEGNQEFFLYARRP